MSSNQKEENKILEKLENNLLKSTDNLQTTPINSDNSKMEQPKQGVKRRRKVILRRRLLRKGDGRSSIVSKSIEDSNTTKNNSKQKRGNNPTSTMAVRRVIWKIVPLKKLPDNEENEEEEDENLINLNNKIIPIKTKTARVVLKRIEEVENKEEDEEENKLKQQRRMARRRTPNLLNNLKKTEESTKSSSTQQSSPIYSALSFPEQLETFLGLSKCYVRIIFDFWCLLECFCSALFLLALYLKFKCLAVTSICVDVVSVVLAIIFGFSTLVFTLVLLLLPSNLPSKPILECFGLTTIIHIAIALFAWITCIEIKVAKMN
uniref:Uncharacterized protein n=1 Tax=Meloidogyne enterolobii TaxID=390850 RepID=A0A6V7VCQ0_MELEN|nr:unnamed protein product [Meloidogyne enterolobii]